MSKRITLPELTRGITLRQPVDASKFHFKRRIAYPAIHEQLDMLFHDIEAGLFGAKAKTSSWYKEIDRVKKEHPKETK